MSDRLVNCNECMHRGENGFCTLMQTTIAEPLRKAGICASFCRSLVASTSQATADANARGEGYKADAEKPDWSLLPLDVVEDVVRVLTVGAKKYARDNWQKVPNARERYFAAALRHMTAWQKGEENDPETGLPHLAHAQCCLVFMAWLDKHGDKR